MIRRNIAAVERKTIEPNSGNNFIMVLCYCSKHFFHFLISLSVNIIVQQILVQFYVVVKK